MGRSDYLRLGDWNAKCDQCGASYKASELRLQYDGLRACSRCWDYRNPQELMRPIIDPKPVPWTRPQPPEITVLPALYPRTAGSYLIDARSIG